MRRTTVWMVALCYYLSQILGIMPFCYDYGKGEIYTSTSVTVYSAVLSMTWFGLIPMMLRIDFHSPNSISHDLHLKISAVICLVRFTAVLASVISQWFKRGQLMATLNKFHHIREQFVSKWPLHTKVEQNLEHAIRSKFLWGFVANVGLFLGSTEFLRVELKLQNPWEFILLAIMCNILNMVILHFYFCVIHVNALLEAINNEVKQILRDSKNLCHLRRLGYIPTAALERKSALLAENLYELANIQFELQRLTYRLNDVYDVQCACTMLTMYMNNVAVFYMFYMVMQHAYILKVYGLDTFVLMLISLTFYYMDLKVFMDSLWNYIGHVEETGEILKQLQPCMLTKYRKLEESFKNFSLQLAKFPVEMKLVGLFKFDRSMAFSIFGSTISNAIVLIQYDYKNNSDE
uniref:Gustatory receptor n=1 Tax=Stomoxys calcitrans TaxID=35570 RepID=A0A454A0Q5_STOCA